MALNALVGASMTFRDYLKAGTTDSHRRIDESMGGLDLSNASDYCAFLTIHGKIVPPVERWLESNGVWRDLPDWRDRRRSSALLQDFERLGAEPPQELSCEFDNSASSRAGILYVMEGSRLGASFLVRRLQDAESKLPSEFLMHGIGLSLWPTFVDWLNRKRFCSNEEGKALQSARAVFALYDRAVAADYRMRW